MTGFGVSRRSSPCLPSSDQLSRAAQDAGEPAARLPGHGVEAMAGWAPRAAAGPGAACGRLPLLWLPVWREAGGCRLPPRDP